MAGEQIIPEGHITLKEAARISGYAPDYVGQLIRKGKLYGRQVYMNVAWVTTEAAVQEYIKNQAGGVTPPVGGAASGMLERWRAFENRMFSEARLSVFLRTVLYLGLALSVALILLLISILAVSLDRSLERQAVERLEKSDVLSR